MPIERPVADACDCHVHIVGSIEHYPQITSRSYTAGPATLDTLRTIAEPRGVHRFVLVQPSFYGTDNACLLDALETLGESARGVAAVDAESLKPQLLREYEQRGVRGLRVNLYSAVRNYPPQYLDRVLETTAGILPDASWHLEIIAPLPMLAAAAATIAHAKATIVIDHYGLPGQSAPDSSEGRCLLELAALPHVWVKLSAPYRILNDPLATALPADWLKALVQVAPERCVWGSDWPHTPAQEDRPGANREAAYRKIDYGQALESFCAALAEPDLIAQILTANPRRLFGFPAD